MAVVLGRTTHGHQQLIFVFARHLRLAVVFASIDQSRRPLLDKPFRYTIHLGRRAQSCLGDLAGSIAAHETEDNLGPAAEHGIGRALRTSPHHSPLANRQSIPYRSHLLTNFHEELLSLVASCKTTQVVVSSSFSYLSQIRASLFSV